MDTPKKNGGPTWAWGAARFARLAVAGLLSCAPVQEPARPAPPTPTGEDTRVSPTPALPEVHVTPAVPLPTPVAKVASQSPPAPGAEPAVPPAAPPEERPFARVSTPGPHDVYLAARASLASGSLSPEVSTRLAEELQALGEGPLRSIRGAVELLTAEAWLRSPTPERALALTAPRELEGPPEPTLPSQEARRLELHAAALEALGKNGAAVDAWIERSRQSPDWRVTLRAISALAVAGRVKEAARLLKSYEVHEGPVNRAAYVELAGLGPEAALTHEELVMQLETLANTGRTGALLDSVARVAASRLATRETLCRAAALEAQALARARRYKVLVGARARLTETCARPLEGEAETRRRENGATIAWSLGKALRARKQLAEAAQSFADVVSLSKDSRLADDAQLARAAILRARGEHRAADLALEDALRRGDDQAEEAAFQLFWSHYTAGRRDQAAATARAALTQLAPSAISAARGRMAYWYARSQDWHEPSPSAEAGGKSSAVAAYHAVIARYPLTWYALLAEARLRAAGHAPPTLPQAPPSTSQVVRFAEALQRPDVAEAIALLRLGEPRLSDLEAATKQLPDGAWLTAWVAGQVDLPVPAYRTLRWGLGEAYAERPPLGEHATWWRLAHPRPEAFKDAVDRFAAANQLEAAYVWAVIQTESAYQPTARSAAKARGLMQLIRPTAEAMAKREGLGAVDLDDPETNIRLGTRYLRRLRELLGDNLALIAAGYNAGPGRPRKWVEQRLGAELDELVENIPYREARRYVKSVMTAYARYRWLYDGTLPPPLDLTLPPG